MNWFKRLFCRPKYKAPVSPPSGLDIPYGHSVRLGIGFRPISGGGGGGPGGVLTSVIIDQRKNIEEVETAVDKSWESNR